MLRPRAIDLAPERHHQTGDAVEPFPAPLVEFRRLAVARRQRIDFIVGAGEAQREPLLALAAEFCQPGRRRTAIRRKLVSKPVDLAEILGAPPAGLLPELAHHRL